MPDAPERHLHDGNVVAARDLLARRRLDTPSFGLPEGSYLDAAVGVLRLWHALEHLRGERHAFLADGDFWAAN